MLYSLLKAQLCREMGSAKAMFTDLRNFMRNSSTFLLACFFILPFTDLRNFTYRKKFSLQKVEVSQKVAKKRWKERIFCIANFAFFSWVWLAKRLRNLTWKHVGKVLYSPRGLIFFFFFLDCFLTQRESYLMRCVLLPQDDTINDIEP